MGVRLSRRAQKAWPAWTVRESVKFPKGASAPESGRRWRRPRLPGHFRFIPRPADASAARAASRSSKGTVPVLKIWVVCPFARDENDIAFLRETYRFPDGPARSARTGNSSAGRADARLDLGDDAAGLARGCRGHHDHVAQRAGDGPLDRACSGRAPRSRRRDEAVARGRLQAPSTASKALSVCAKPFKTWNPAVHRPRRPTDLSSSTPGGRRPRDSQAQGGGGGGGGVGCVVEADQGGPKLEGPPRKRRSNWVPRRSCGFQWRNLPRVHAPGPAEAEGGDATLEHSRRRRRGRDRPG